jgi:hypothetical protein
MPHERMAGFGTHLNCRERPTLGRRAEAEGRYRPEPVIPISYGKRLIVTEAAGERPAGSAPAIAASMMHLQSQNLSS